MTKKEIPVYLFTGFLESGKTTFIGETLTDPQFNAGERTLVLLCEEGEEELDISSFPKKNVYIEVIASPEDLTPARLSALQRNHRAERVMVEYNGMWPLGILYNALPEDWMVYQEVLILDGTTFLEYNANLRQQMYDKLSSADPVIFNRLPHDFDKMLFHKTVRAASRNCNIVYEYADKQVEADEIEDPLPFDVTAPVIAVEDKDFAYLYQDMSEKLKEYDGKTVKFKGIVVKDPKFPKGYIAVGRQMMFCCAEDMAYRAFAAQPEDPTPFRTGMWIDVTGRITVKKCPLYQGQGPVLEILSWQPATPPEQPIATF